MLNLNVFFSILENSALLLALVYVCSLSPLYQRKVDPALWPFYIGALVGVIGIIIMMFPLVEQQPILFNASSVAISLSGLFFGAIPTAIAIIIMALYRYFLGGEAVAVGIFILISSAMIGLIWRRFRMDKLDQISYVEFYLFGVAVHAVLLNWLFLLPSEQALAIFTLMSLPIMAVLPLLTLIIGHFLSQIVSSKNDIQVKLQDDFLFKNQFDIGNIGISISTKNKYWLRVNPYLCRMFGYSEKELTSLTWQALTHPDDLNKDLLLYEEMLKGQLNEYEIDKRFIAKDGSVVYTHMTITCRRHIQDDTFLVIAAFLDITERKQAEQALLHSKEQLALVLDSSELGVWDWDVVSHRISTNRYSAEILGCTMDELNLQPERWIDAIHAKDKFKFLRSINEIITGRSISQRVEYQLIDSQGVWRWILQTGSVVDVDAKGKPLRVFGTHSDITDIKQVEDSLSIASSVYQNSSEAMSVFTANGIIIDSNPAFSFITGFTQEDIQNQHLSMFETDLQPKHFYQQLTQQLSQQGHWHGEVWMRRKNGESYLILLTINSIVSKKSQADRFVALFSDVTEKKQTEELIWRQANYDALTGLPNRRMLLTFLNQEVLLSDRKHNHFALMFLDLDYFKEINDTLGHDMGDVLLLETAARLKQCIRETDVVARLGGDEFTIVLANLEDTHGVDRVAQQILKQLSKPYLLGEQTAYISASIGITLFPDDAKTTEGLLKNADQAMYSAKKLGRNRFNYFTSAMQDSAQKRMLLIRDLKVAITQQQFELYYQPIVDLSCQQVIKAEALIRWHHPTVGVIPPADFISIAEETGMVVDIGNWVFYQACEQAKKWKAQFNADVQISINMSSVQFKDESTQVEDWLNYMHSLALPTNSICIEIIESLLLEIEPNVEAKLLAYADAGIQISLDDFGSGYSSLAYLKKFNINYLKIDKGLVNSLYAESNEKYLCEAIIAMAHKLGIEVIAEGIETENQRQLMELAGCDYAQGYIFSHALCRHDFEQKYLVNKVTQLKLTKVMSR